MLVVLPELFVRWLSYIRKCSSLARRDLANSSSERFTLSHASALCEDVLAKTRDVLTNMWVDAERCLQSIKSQKGLVMAEKVMIDVVDHGIPRDEAHEILRAASFEAVDNIELIDVCSRTPEIVAAFSAEELKQCLNRLITSVLLEKLLMNVSHLLVKQLLERTKFRRHPGYHPNPPHLTFEMSR